MGDPGGATRLPCRDPRHCGRVRGAVPVPGPVLCAGRPSRGGALRRLLRFPVLYSRPPIDDTREFLRQESRHPTKSIMGTSLEYIVSVSCRSRGFAYPDPFSFRTTASPAAAPNIMAPPTLLTIRLRARDGIGILNIEPDAA